MEDYWDSPYPTHIEVPDDYWVCSSDVEYIES